MTEQLAALYAKHVATLTEGFGRALEAEGFDAVAIHSGKLVLQSDFDDNYWPMRPVPMFEYWASVPWPDCVVYVPFSGTPRLVVLRESSFWERPREPDWALIQRGLEVVEVNSHAALAEALPVTSRTAFIGAKPEHAAELGIELANPAGLLERLHDLRVIKTPYEVACLAEASRRAARGHEAIARAFFAGERSELRLHLTYLEASGQDDAETPYKNIVALGEAASILHHIFYRDAPAAKSLLVDAGARHRGYNCDITRTHADAAGPFADLVAGMEALQQAIVSEVAVGKPYEQLHDDAHRHLAKLLVESGIATVSEEACVEGGITRKLFPHGLGHSLGIQTHDVGCRKTPPKPENPFLRNTRTIEPGQIFTIEPGLYFIDSLLTELKEEHPDALDWSKVDALRPYGGIRIEDNVLVLPEGSTSNVRNFTREAFAALASG